MKFDLRVSKLSINSNASRKAWKFVNFLNIHFRPRKSSTYIIKGTNGRSKTGSIITYSKGSVTRKLINPRINYSFRLNSISFISNLMFLPKQNKFVSTLFMSSGIITYIPTTDSHTLFTLNMYSELFTQYYSYLQSASKVNPHFRFKKFTTVIKNLPKNDYVCLLEQLPYTGVKYSRAVGSSSKILKMDSRTGLSLIKLPSGFTKVFSIYSLGSRGSVSPETKINLLPNKAGYYVSLGRKSQTRCVAMNPVDHPHGGRTKSIKNPRTPWGFSAKKK